MIVKSSMSQGGVYNVLDLKITGLSKGCVFRLEYTDVDQSITVLASRSPSDATVTKHARRICRQLLPNGFEIMQVAAGWSCFPDVVLDNGKSVLGIKKVKIVGIKLSSEDALQYHHGWAYSFRAATKEQ